MKQNVTYRVVVASCLCLSSFWAQAGSQSDARGVTPPNGAVERIASAQVPFIKNEGQIPNPDVLFYAQMFAGTVFVTTDSRLVYAFPRTNPDGRELWAFREEFAGAQQAGPTGSQQSSISVSHFKGNDPDRWRTRLQAFDSLDLGEIYPGIRANLKAAGNNVEKVFVVAPGAEPAAINIKIDGVEDININSRNELVLGTSLGDIAFTAPIAYQEENGSRQPVEVAYVLADEHHYSFKVGTYDTGRELVIDPLLASTFIGGHNPQSPGNYDDDIIYSMITAGNDLYVAGVTQSPDFPIHLGYDTTLANAYPDGFITLMSGDLSTVIASTYIGTDGFDRVTDIALDDDGKVIAIGQAGYGFPVTDGAYTWNGSATTGGGFVARFSADLSALEGSAVPTPSDYPWQVVLGNGGIYFGGSTNNPSFPITPDAYLSTCCPLTGSYGIREYDGFAGKLSMDLGTLEAMTYLGGNTVSGMAVASDGSVYITDGWDYAVSGYIARFDAGLTERPAYLSYYPGSNSGSSRTYFNDVAIKDGYVVTAGETYMNDLPATDGAFDTSCGTDGICNGVGPLLVPKSDGFVAIYSSDLQSTLRLTYLGGSDYESIRSVAVGADGAILVAGETTSVDFPTAGTGPDTSCGTDGTCNASDPYSPIADGFVARLSADLAQLKYGTYLGGSGEDRPLAVTVAGSGHVLAAGRTDSSDFPTTDGVFDTSYNGGTADAFISSFDTGPGDMVFVDYFESGSVESWFEN